MTNKEKLFFIIPAMWAALFDIFITVFHQSPAYWNGDLNQANEGNPIGAYAMASHVSGLFMISVIWLILIVFLGYKLPHRFSRIFLLFALISHSYGASTWLSNHYGFWSSIAFILFNSILYFMMEDLIMNEKKGAIVRAKALN